MFSQLSLNVYKLREILNNFNKLLQESTGWNEHKVAIMMLNATFSSMDENSPNKRTFCIDVTDYKDNRLIFYYFFFDENSFELQKVYRTINKEVGGLPTRYKEDISIWRGKADDLFFNFRKG